MKKICSISLMVVTVVLLTLSVPVPAFSQTLKSSTGGVATKGYVQNIEDITVKNKDFRRVLYTARNCQLVVMALKPKEEIGWKSTNSINSFAWRRVPVRRFSMAFGRRSGRASR